MGHRIHSSEINPGSYQDVVYSKGGYVLQMLREQLTDSRNPDPDHLFKEMMQDYCKTFDNKPASTEDFKGIVEKHMLRNMDLDGNHKMDWFFNQYVYGMGMAHYNFHATLEPTADGKTHVKAELTRSGVPESWKDVVPLYAHAGDKVFRLGSLAATHSTEPLGSVMVSQAISSPFFVCRTRKVVMMPAMVTGALCGWPPSSAMSMVENSSAMRAAAARSSRARSR